MKKDIRIKQFFPSSFNIISEKLGRYEETEQDVENIINILSLSKGESILDVPCGFGRYSYLFYKKGYNVIGVDISEKQISIAKNQYSGPTYLVSDMIEYSPKNKKFNAIINLYSSFGYSKDPDDDIAIMKNWFNLLQDNGQLLMQLSDLERTKFKLKIKSGETIERINKNVKEQLSIDWEAQILFIDYFINNNKKAYCNMRIYSKEQLLEMAYDVGFKEVKIYGDFCGKEKENSDRLILVCKKV